MWSRLCVLLTLLHCVVTSLCLVNCPPAPGQVESIHPFGVTDHSGTSSLNITWKRPQSFNGILKGYIIRLFNDDVCVNLTYLLRDKNSEEKDIVHEHKVGSSSYSVQFRKFYRPSKSHIKSGNVSFLGVCFTAPRCWSRRSSMCSLEDFHRYS